MTVPKTPLHFHSLLYTEVGNLWPADYIWLKARGNGSMIAQFSMSPSLSHTVPPILFTAPFHPLGHMLLTTAAEFGTPHCYWGQESMPKGKDCDRWQRRHVEA